MLYKTERIENLGDLEAIHTSLYMDACNLRAEFEKEKPNKLYIEELIKAIHMEAHKAIDFEFCITQRTVKEL